MYSYGKTRISNINPLVTTYLKIREEALHLLYCVNDPSPYTPSAFPEMLFHAFDYTTWACLLVAIVCCALTAKFISAGDPYPVFDIFCVLFRQDVSFFKPLHLILSLVLIPVLFMYEADITAHVITPNVPNIYNNFEQLINNSFAILVNKINIGGGTTADEYESIPYKIADANLTSKNMINFYVAIRQLRKIIQELVERRRKYGETRENDTKAGYSLTEDGITNLLKSAQVMLGI